MPNREKAIISSVIRHNDEGSESLRLSLHFNGGVERIEGTLFGNGGKDRNFVVTMAMNMFSQGVDPQLYLKDMKKIVDVSEECTKNTNPCQAALRWRVSVHCVFGISPRRDKEAGMKCFVWNRWLLGSALSSDRSRGCRRPYRETVRLNSQSGKGGVAFVLEHYFGVTLPRALLMEFSSLVQEISERVGGELKPDEIWRHCRRST